MARTSAVFARVEPELKEQAESVLEQLGIPMSNAIGMFLRQVVLQSGIPFNMKLPRGNHQPLSFGALTDEQFDAEINKGLADLAAGKVVSADSVAGGMSRDYDA
ncbi:MAG: type II toxin-antitoxin system RelB/DinJ family antitoxin [Synergistaceae bacterium]|nr:type II toxin-antitoxin system RelB/DinJ family antitoxin [Synergistaceae bacterium]